MGMLCTAIGFVIMIAALVALMVSAGAAAWLMELFEPSEHAGYETHDCPKCEQPLRYRIRLPKKIRCSCGNIMPVPAPTQNSRTRHVSCPGCLQTIHVSPIKAPSRVRCRCGNISGIPV